MTRGHPLKRDVSKRGQYSLIALSLNAIKGKVGSQRTQVQDAT